MPFDGVALAESKEEIFDESILCIEVDVWDGIFAVGCESVGGDVDCDDDEAPIIPGIE